MLRNGPFQPLMMGRAKKVWSWSKEEGRADSWATRQYQNKITFTFSIIKQKHFHFLQSKVFLMMGRAKKVWSWSKEEGRADSWATRQYQNKITFTFSIIKQKHFHFLQSKVFLMMGRAKKVWSWSKEEGCPLAWANRQYQNKITFTFFKATGFPLPIY